MICPPGGWQRLAWIELPLASVTIITGIKTAAVLTVGTATLAASARSYFP